MFERQLDIIMADGIEPTFTSGIATVSLKNYVLVIGGKWPQEALSLQRVLWCYNLYTEQWKKYAIPDSKTAPSSTFGGCTIAIGSDVYMFGGFLIAKKGLTNAMWKLSQSSDNRFVWEHISILSDVNKPSPRAFHTGWEYDGKLWVFGGNEAPPLLIINDKGFSLFSPAADYNNDLLSFYPSSNKWMNQKCSGTIPEPREMHTTTIIWNKVWLYGGVNSRGGSTRPFNDFYELNMDSLTWSEIKSGIIKPKGRFASSLTAVSKTQLVLHCGIGSRLELLDDTWIWDMTSHSWRQHVSNKDHPRVWHTAVRGSNNSVIITGGKNTIANNHSATNGTIRSIHRVMLEPKSLQHLAVLEIHRNHSSLHWSNLPPKLIALLRPLTDAEENPMS